MAFSFINSNIYNSNASNTISLTKPTNTQDGDIMFVMVFDGYYNGVTSVPSGWSSIGSYEASRIYWNVYYKVASSEGSSYDWVFTNSIEKRGLIITYRGDFNISNPINTSSVSSSPALDTAVTAPSITVSKTDSPLIFLGGMQYTSTVTFTKPAVPTTDWVENVDSGSTSPSAWMTACSMKWTSSGVTGNVTATASVPRIHKMACVIALNPPSVGPANLKSYNTNLSANIKTINTNPIANVKTLNTNV